MWLTSDGLNVSQILSLSLGDAKPEDCLHELIQYVHHIADTMPSPYTLFVSGGIDSQATLHVWKQSGVPFRAVNVNYDGFNVHDRKEILEFCESHSIPLDIISFDVIDFLENRLEAYAIKYQCASPQICTHMAFSEMVHEGTKIFSGNLAARTLSIDNTVFGLYRYAQLSGNSMIPFFLMGSEVASKAAIALADTVTDDSGVNYNFKCEQYRKLGVPIIKQEEKLTGFEKVKIYYDRFPERVTSWMKVAFSSAKSKRVFDQLFRNPYLARFKNHYDVTIIVNQ